MMRLKNFARKCTRQQQNWKQRLRNCCAHSKSPPRDGLVDKRKKASKTTVGDYDFAFMKKDASSLQCDDFKTDGANCTIVGTGKCGPGGRLAHVGAPLTMGFTKCIHHLGSKQKIHFYQKCSAEQLAMSSDALSKT